MVSKQDKRFNIILYIIIGIFAAITLFPLLHILACSFSSPMEIFSGKVVLFPRGITLETYAKIFEDNLIIRGYLNTIMYAVIGTVIGLILQISAGYVLTRKDMPFRQLFNLLFVITMFVNGGLIPTYIVVKELGMINSIWAMIIPGCISAFNVVIVRTYISTAIPWDLTEAAVIDGANDLKIFLKIIIPLSRPIIVIIALYGIVGYWNSYFNALLYITKEEIQPLQMILRKILIASDVSSIGSVSYGQSEQALLTESLKYATIVVATVPILCIYPFAQKYFEQGMMIGGLKG